MNPYFDIHESIWTYMGFKIPPDRVTAFRTALARIRTGQYADAITDFLDLRMDVFQHGPNRSIQVVDHDDLGCEISRLAMFENYTTQFEFPPHSDYTTVFDTHTGRIQAIVAPIRDSYGDVLPRFRTAMQRFLGRKQQRDAGTQALMKRGVLPPELVAMIVSYV